MSAKSPGNRPAHAKNDDKSMTHQAFGLAKFLDCACLFWRCSFNCIAGRKKITPRTNPKR